MPKKGYTWTDEYRANYYSSESVQAHLDSFRALVRQPKPEGQREKISAALTGRAKTAEQRIRMSATHRRRCALRKQLREENPTWTDQELWARVRSIMKDEQ